MNSIKTALEHYSLSEKEPIILVRESSDNSVFQIGKKDRKILRVSKRLPISDVKYEYEAMQKLREGNVVVPRWVTTNTGSFHTLVDGAVAVLFDFIHGNHITVDKENLPTTAQAYTAGAVLGRMSNAAENFVSTSPRNRTIFSELERVVSLASTFENDFEGGKVFVEQVRAAIEFAKTQHEATGFIHNDFRPSNVFFDDKQMVNGIIDFDWSCNGPLIKDLALALVEWSFPDGATEPNMEVFDSFLSGYNSVAKHKATKDNRLYSWIAFATLSDAATYFCDLATDPESTKRIIKSYMYRKFVYFSALIK